LTGRKGNEGQREIVIFRECVGDCVGLKNDEIRVWAEPI
jgi:hypothetical protein